MKYCEKSHNPIKKKVMTTDGAKHEISRKKRRLKKARKIMVTKAIRVVKKMRRNAVRSREAIEERSELYDIMMESA